MQEKEVKRLEEERKSRIWILLKSLARIALENQQRE